MEEFIGTGKRKTAVASVRMRKGSGKVDVNKREMGVYFPSEFERKKALMPLEMTKLLEQFDLLIRVKGGGSESQAEAVRLGLARALVSYDENLRQQLKEFGFLTRDSRKKERKKYGQPGARKNFQFSKR